MYKNKFLIIVFLISFVFIACSKEEISNSEENKSQIIDEEFVEASIQNEFEEFIENNESENITLESKSENNIVLHSDYIYESNIDWFIDLDGDNKNETIYYETEIINEEKIAHLWINGIDFKNYINIYEPLDTHFFIVDTDKDDNYFEILISTYGMSNDLESQWFRYINGVLFDLGNTEMMPNNFMYFNNDSTITIYSRTDIFGTNFIPVKYTINKNKLKSIKEDFYNFGLVPEFPFYCSIDLNVHIQNSKESEIIILPEGTEFVSTKTDGKEWVNILVQDKEYWLHIKDFNLIDNENLFVGNVIQNLILAD